MADIGDVKMALVDGEWARRAGWNGKGMHIYLEASLSVSFGAGVLKGQTRKYKPCLVLVTPRGEHQPGWVCSQEDFLADDWEITVGGQWPDPIASLVERERRLSE